MRFPSLTLLCKTDLFLLPVFSLTKPRDLHYLWFNPLLSDETVLVKNPWDPITKILSTSCSPSNSCLVIFSSSVPIFLDQLPSTAVYYLQDFKSQLLLSANVLMSAHVVKYHGCPLPQWVDHITIFFCIHFPLPINNFLFSPSHPWSLVAWSQGANCQSLSNSTFPKFTFAIDSLLFCREARILEKYANFISRKMAYSLCSPWNESAVRRQEYISVIPLLLCSPQPYQWVHLGPFCTSQDSDHF